MKNKLINHNFPVLIIGITILIFVHIFYGHTISFMKNAVKTTAIVTSVKDWVDKTTEQLEVTVGVKYDVDGVEYTNEYIIPFIPFTREGGNVTIYYDKENPGRIEPSGFFIPYIFYTFLGIIGVYSYISCTNEEKKKNKKDAENRKYYDKYKNMRKLGKIIYANIEKVEKNKFYTLNGERPYIIKCSYFNQTTNELYDFESENIMYDVKKLIELNNITTIPVKLRKNKYYVDVKSLNKYIDKDHIEVYNKNE